MKITFTETDRDLHLNDTLTLIRTCILPEKFTTGETLNQIDRRQDGLPNSWPKVIYHNLKHRLKN